MRPTLLLTAIFAFGCADSGESAQTDVFGTQAEQANAMESFDSQARTWVDEFVFKGALVEVSFTGVPFVNGHLTIVHENDQGLTRNSYLLRDLLDRNSQPRPETAGTTPTSPEFIDHIRDDLLDQLRTSISTIGPNSKTVGIAVEDLDWDNHYFLQQLIIVPHIMADTIDASYRGDIGTVDTFGRTALPEEEDYDYKNTDAGQYMLDIPLFMKQLERASE